MPNVLDLRRRIRSVKNTQQITRAMKMVAAARLRRAQERVVNARPYAAQMLSVLGRVAARVASGEQPDEPLHPLLAERPAKRVLLVLITADRGLCGAFNANLIRAAQSYLARHQDEEVSLIAVGRKGRDFFRKHEVTMRGDYVNLFNRLEFSQAQEIAGQIIKLYTTESIDAVDFIYNEFKSIMAQRLAVERYLPIKPITPPEGEAVIDYIYEQSPQEIFNSLLPRYVETQVYRALLESQAAEFAARMTAMDAATNNAGDLIDSLTLYLNRVRQAAITKEIIEIVSGASAQG
jgi:F-type H+-transporting ATPase subunit gamma